jgi:hypothetical protein
MLDYPVILSISGVIIVLLAIVLSIMSGSIFVGIVILFVAGLVLFLLRSFGVLDVSVRKDGLHLDFHENVPAPASKSHHEKRPTLNIKEVFYVEGENYTFNDSAAVCAAYGAELASYDQLMEAFSLGAEWCGYGWSAGGMALYPTQESTWLSMQSNPMESARTACGRPGINGGYFDPRSKFGVNCYGIRPKGHNVKFPLAPPGQDNATFDGLVSKFKSMLATIQVSPFNRQTWSQSGEAKLIANQTKQKVQSIPGMIEKDIGALL